MRTDEGSDIKDGIARTDEAAEHVEFFLRPFPILAQGIENEIIAVGNGEIPIAAA